MSFGPDGLPTEPADGVEKTMSLDDNPVLQPLFDKKTPQLPDQGEDPDVADGQEVDPEDGTQRKGRRDGMLERINKLTRQKYEAKEENDTLRSQLASLTEHVSKLQQQIAGTAPRAENSALSFLPKRDGQNAEQESDDIASIVRREIQAVLQPVAQEREAMAEQQALFQKHQALMPDLLQEYPDLAKQDSDLQVAFRQIYDTSPDLRKLDNAPVLIAAIARGVVADTRRDEQSRAARKRAAGIHTPVPEHSDVPVSEQRQSATVKGALEAARERMRNGTADFDDYKLVRQATAKALGS